MRTNQRRATKRTALLGGALGIAFAASACSAGYDRAELIDELVAEQGVTTDVATCIADGVEQEIGLDRLDDRGNPTPEEEQAVIDITVDCVLGNG